MKGMTVTRMAVLAVAALMLGGCPTVISEVVQKAWEDRSTSDQVDDTEIFLDFKKASANIDSNLLLDVSADAWEGRVMLTGTVDSAEVRDRVVAILKADRRVNAIYNEILVVSTAERDQRRAQAEIKDEAEKNGIGQSVNDFWIETKIKAQLLTARNVTSVNYRWRSVRNTVYVIGRAPDREEMDKVLGIVGETEGVVGVKHFIVVKPAA